ncbi:hypothetical protein CSW58_04865 [Caulobacter sp. B11]|uniref:hypothetical protein n=1 Tax=Caulobacter sp. B11 TaxID=2048899 RepID=UPI000C129C2E|nr:hypothetical protein [Caulobacter sp. B11]PHY13565.1 hypothetical protein CSW58_04865 [Caulobacter sp. B11]
MSDNPRFALLRTPTDPLCKPVAFADLSELAQALHRDRGEAAIQMFEAPLLVFGEDQPRAGVSLWTLDADGAQARYLGWAWLDGGGHRALRAALDAARADVPVIGRAA